jgi:hypothetical protein
MLEGAEFSVPSSSFYFHQFAILFRRDEAIPVFSLSGNARET